MYDGEEMEGNPLELRQQENNRENECNRNIGNVGSNHRCNAHHGGQDDHGNHGGSRDQGGEGGNEGQGGDGGNEGQGGDGGNEGHITRKEFLKEIKKINTAMNQKFDEINNTIRLLLQG